MTVSLTRRLAEDNQIRVERAGASSLAVDRDTTSDITDSAVRTVSDGVCV